MSDNQRASIQNIVEILGDVQVVARGISGTMDKFYLNDISVDRDQLFMFSSMVKDLAKTLSGAEDDLEIVERSLASRERP